jgi:hypothetical protein
MNIIGKYDNSSIDIEGSAESLRELSEVIQSFIGSELFSLYVPSTSPSPYLGYAKSLKLERGGGNVRVFRHGAEISISGSPEKLLIFARNIGRLAEQENHTRSDPYHDHIHIDYHPGHFYLDEESIPLVVTRRSSAE